MRHNKSRRWARSDFEQVYLSEGQTSRHQFTEADRGSDRSQGRRAQEARRKATCRGMNLIVSFSNGGEGGIRTHGRLLDDSRSPGVPDRPLQHLSLFREKRTGSERGTDYSGFILGCKTRLVAERVGFEPTLAETRPLFESGTINHSDTSPNGNLWG